VSLISPTCTGAPNEGETVSIGLQQDSSHHTVAFLPFDYNLSSLSNQPFQPVPRYSFWISIMR
jgi:hypothetical protein